MTDSDETVPDQSEQLDLQPDEELLLETGRNDVLDGGYEVADHWSAAQGFGNTPAEQAEGESLEQRLLQEEPDVGGEAFGAGTAPTASGTGTHPIDSDVTLDLPGQEDLDNVMDDEHATLAGGSIEALTDPDFDNELEQTTGDLVPGTEHIDDGEVGEEQVVRLVEPNEGLGEDTDKELIGYDAADSPEQSAEEAAVHVVPGS